MIAVDPILNEPSLSPPATDEKQARERMAGAINILAKMPEYGLGKSLRVSKEFYLLELAHGYSVTAWIGDRQVDRDQLRFFLSIAAKAPFIPPADCQAIERLEDTDVSFQGRSHPAFLAAQLLDAPLVSFDHNVWAEPELSATLTHLDGEGELSQEEIVLINFARLVHFENHHSWFARRNAAADPNDLWFRRAEFFPHVIFCESVGRQLAHQATILGLIVARLKEIERVAARGHAFDKDAFGFRCHATSTATLQQFGTDYTFTAPNGTIACCGWHFYLPDGRRLYFSADYVVGHVGCHLPTVKFH